MKNQFTAILVLFVLSKTAGQIAIEPETPYQNLPTAMASINSSNNKPYWMGVQGYAHIYLDSSQYHKVGIGTGYNKLPNGSRSFQNLAKLHIRHEGGPGTFANQAGPHLLLDEATADRSAALRFRQSVEENGNITPGLNYWDIRAFANSGGSIPGLTDYMDFVHPIAELPIMTLRAIGRVGIGVENPLSDLHVYNEIRIDPGTDTESKIHLNGNFSSLNMGFPGSFGKVQYNEVSNTLLLITEETQTAMAISDSKVRIGSSGTPETTLHVDGYTKLGNDAPNIHLLQVDGWVAQNEALSYPFPIPYPVSKVIGIQAISKTANFGWVPTHTTDLCQCDFDVFVTYDSGNDENLVVIKMADGNKANDIKDTDIRILLTLVE